MGLMCFYGVGVDGKINDNMKFRLEFERMYANNDNGISKLHFDIKHIGVGLLFDF